MTAAENEKGRPGEGDLFSSSYSRLPKGTAPRVVIGVSAVVSGRIRDRLEVDVPHCPACGRLHRHRAPVDWLGGSRTAPCGVRYVVRVAGLGVVAA
jgi:hypothetical protein